MLPLDGQVVDRVSVAGLLMLRLNLLEVGATFFLGICLAQNGLVSLILFLLRFNVIEIVLIIWLAEECLVFVGLSDLLVLLLLELSLGTFFELVSEWHG